VRGAFTGAARDRLGLFQAADGGTLFLDEVADTPPEIQPMLLRALETGAVQPVGADAPRQVDVRVVAATDGDLELAIAEGRFRTPLLHRLGGYAIELPALDRRREDIGRLIVHFLGSELDAVTDPTRGLHMPTALVTGATGHLGANLVRELAAHGWTVIPLVRVTSDLSGLSGLDLPLRYGDILDPVSLTTAMEGVDIVFHAAAVHTDWAPDPDAILRPAVQDTENVLRAAAAAGVRRVVYTSSSNAVGFTPDPSAPRDERTWNEDLHLPYVVAKVRAEERAWELAAELGLDVVALLPTGVLGPHDHRITPTTAFIRDVLLGRAPALAAVGNFVHVGDVARAHRLAAERGRPGERYLIGGENLQPEAFLALVEGLTGRRPSVLRAPRIALLALAAAMESWARLTASRPGLTRAMVRTIHGRHAAFDVHKAAEELGFEARGAEAVLADTVRWLTAIGQLPPRGRASRGVGCANAGNLSRQPPVRPAPPAGQRRHGPRVRGAGSRPRGAGGAEKTLTRTDPLAVYLFKQEFRVLSDVVHPNLVGLYELDAVDDVLFFTMELVDGAVDLLRAIRGTAHASGHTWLTLGGDLDPDATLPPALFADDAPLPPGDLPAPTPLDPEVLPRARRLLGQLAEGLAALHHRRRLHRDVKPFNVLVTPEDRVVLVDFGLVAALDADLVAHDRVIAGSVPYMSPEQSIGDELTPASDWYAFGALLYEVLTGRPPFAGARAAVLAAKRGREVVPPRQVVSGVPDDLDALCVALLDTDPTARPLGDAVLRTFGHAAMATALVAPALVGRARERAALDGALERVRHGEPVTLHVRGASGMGKSSLVADFLGSIAPAEALVLSSRCYERDHVAFKAVDPLVDTLVAWIAGLPPGEAEVLAPRHVRALAQLFPVVDRVAAFAQAGQRDAPAADPREQRRRGIEALRTLLARVAERRLLVIAIDDLQWADRDSASVLRQIMRPPDPPVAQLVLAYRAEALEHSDALRQLPPPAAGAVVTVGPLDPVTTRELIASLVGDRRVDVAALADEARGSPFFATELAYGALAGTGLGLDALLRSRVAELPPAARVGLEVVALAGPPQSGVRAGGSRAQGGPGLPRGVGAPGRPRAALFGRRDAAVVGPRGRGAGAAGRGAGGGRGPGPAVAVGDAAPVGRAPDRESPASPGDPFPIRRLGRPGRAPPDRHPGPLRVRHGDLRPGARVEPAQPGDLRGAVPGRRAAPDQRARRRGLHLPPRAWRHRALGGVLRRGRGRRPRGRPARRAGLGADVPRRRGRAAGADRRGAHDHVRGARDLRERGARVDLLAGVGRPVPRRVPRLPGRPRRLGPSAAHHHRRRAGPGRCGHRGPRLARDGCRPRPDPGRPGRLRRPRDRRHRSVVAGAVRPDALLRHHHPDAGAAVPG
jgi:nucleoside-diphosphate-sugar epimerase